MPRNKDQKRLIRSRMRKTGESYTAARAVIVARHKRDQPRSAVPRRQWAALAGISDAKVKKATGRTWSEWVAALDRAAAQEMSHRDIARHISATYPKVNGWWAQSITVGYERIRGLRDVGQRRDGSYDANKSRTFPASVSTLYRMFRDVRHRRKWLPEGVAKVRTAIVDKSMRVDWRDGTQVNFYFVSRGPAKSTVAVQHAKLASRADIEKAKSFWDAQLDVLETTLARGSASPAR